MRPGSRLHYWGLFLAWCLLGAFFYLRFLPGLQSIHPLEQDGFLSGIFGLLGASLAVVFSPSRWGQLWSALLVSSLYLAQIQIGFSWTWLDLGALFLAQERLSRDLEDAGFHLCPFNRGAAAALFFLPPCWIFSAPLVGLYLTYKLAWNLWHWPTGLSFAALFVTEHDSNQPLYESNGWWQRP